MSVFDVGPNHLPFFIFVVNPMGKTKVPGCKAVIGRNLAFNPYLAWQFTNLK